MNSISELLDLLTLEKLEVNLFRGQSSSIGTKRVFGGQVLAQALSAAMQTVQEDRHMHSMHAYFILPGDPEQPIVYEVDRIRDGGSFTTRRIVAIQHGRAIFNMAASFQKKERGFDHQFNMPDVPGPDALLNDDELLSHFRPKIPEKIYERLAYPRPIEFKSVEGIHYLSSQKGEPRRHVWMRSKGKMTDDLDLHRSVLLYASDYNLLTTALRPHQPDFTETFLASLDHAMWIHRDFRMDEWLLFDLDSPSASNGRGFTRGNIFNEQGLLVASMVQEGLIRKRF